MRDQSKAPQRFIRQLVFRRSFSRKLPSSANLPPEVAAFSLFPFPQIIVWNQSPGLCLIPFHRLFVFILKIILYHLLGPLRFKFKQPRFLFTRTLPLFGLVEVAAVHQSGHLTPCYCARSQREWCLQGPIQFYFPV